MTSSPVSDQSKLRICPPIQISHPDPNTPSWAHVFPAHYPILKNVRQRRGRDLKDLFYLKSHPETLVINKYIIVIKNI